MKLFKTIDTYFYNESIINDDSIKIILDKNDYNYDILKNLLNNNVNIGNIDIINHDIKIKKSGIYIRIILNLYSERERFAGLLESYLKSVFNTSEYEIYYSGKFISNDKNVKVTDSSIGFVKLQKGINIPIYFDFKGLKKDNSNISSSDYESVFCFFYNQLIGVTEKQNLEISNINAQLYNKIQNISSTELEKIKSIVIDLKNSLKSTSPLIHNGKGRGEISNIWKDSYNKLGFSTVPSATKTPKSDIYSQDEKYKISVKNYDTGYQLMSGTFAETYCVVVSSLQEYCKSDNLLKNKLDNLFNKDKWTSAVSYIGTGELAKKLNRELQNTNNNKEQAINNLMKDLINPDEQIKILNGLEFNKELNILFNDIAKTDLYKKLIIVESITGNNKFNDALSKANTIFAFDLKNGSANVINATNDQYLQKVVANSKFVINFKTGQLNSKSNTVARIVVNEKNNLLLNNNEIFECIKYSNMINESYYTFNENVLNTIKHKLQTTYNIATNYISDLSKKIYLFFEKFFEKLKYKFKELIQNNINSLIEIFNINLNAQLEINLF
jgi:hypothetical protein